MAAQAPAAGSAIGDVPADAWFITRSPAQASTSDLGTAGLAALGAGVALLLDGPVHDWLHSEPFPVRVLAPFGDYGPLGFTGRTTLFLLPLSLTLWTAGHVTSSPELRDAGLGCGTSNLTTTLTRRLLASLLGRLRPEGHEGAFRFRLFAFGYWEARSFFGGHASNIMHHELRRLLQPSLRHGPGRSGALCPRRCRGRLPHRGRGSLDVG